MATDPPTKPDLVDRARELGIAGAAGMNKPDLEREIAAAEEAQGRTRFLRGDEVDLDPPDTPVPGELTGEPASPDDPTDGRPPLATVAEDRLANTYVRVIGAPKED